MKLSPFSFLIVAGCLVLSGAAHAQDEAQIVDLVAEIGPSRETVIDRELTFDVSASTVPPTATLTDIFWDFGDGVKTTGPKVTHAYKKEGTYAVRLRLVADDGAVSEDTSEVRVFRHLIIIATDSTTPEDSLSLRQQQAAQHNVLLHILRTKTNGPEAAVEEELTQLLLNATPDIARAHLLITWNSGGVGASSLSKFAQQLRQTSPDTPPPVANTGIAIISTTPLGVLARSAQTVFDQLQPAYVVISRPEAVELLIQGLTAEAAKNNLVTSPIEYRLLGTFSARTVRDIGPTNFMSFAVSYLINHGVAINSLILLLMLPLIASILSFARQVIGIKAFGLITPAMTTLALLVLGLPYGLIVFAVVLSCGTFIRLLLRRLRLLYLPRMALVLTTVSLGIFGLLIVSTLVTPTALFSFSIFPTLLLIILAEEFIAVQFNSGAKNAFTVTAWTLGLAILGYYVMSWEILRTFIISYPEIILLTIPINILLGRWSGLRLTEYIRFRQLLRYGRST